MIPSYVDLNGSVVESLKLFIDSRNFSKVGVLYDENTKEHCYPLIENSLGDHSVFSVPSGEDHKNLSTCESIWSWMTDSGFDRKSLLINLGGGVIGDMGGFCAATFKRGIDFIQVPTTVLAQVDASIGGKLGVDFTGFKNHIGVFQLPAQVIVDPIFINTLPERHIRSGFSEMIKHGLIQKRQIYESLMSKNLDELEWLEVIHDSIKIKSEIVESDPFEKGPRKLLNFGHSIGHAIESYFLNNKSQELLHGEAIAIGMICESWISTQILKLPISEMENIQEHILKTFGKVDLTDLETGEFVLNLTQDKKNEGNQILFTLLAQIGEGKFDIPVKPELAIESVNYYNNL